MNLRKIERETNSNQSLIAGIAFIFVFIFLAMIVYFYSQLPEVVLNQTVIHISGDNVLTNNLSIICVTGYSSTVRDVPQRLREEIFARDNVSYALELPTGSTELDHRISLSLGGSNAASNLMVQFETYPGYHEKDKLENYLLKHVCNGEIDIATAQARMYYDWKSYYYDIYGKNNTETNQTK